MKPKHREGLAHKCLKAMGLPRANHEVVRRIKLHHPPHSIDIFWRPAPVALNGQVAEPKRTLQTTLDVASSFNHLPRYEAFGPERRFVIEQNPIHSPKPVRFPINVDNPM